jgi:cytochrome oxidase assembly protein ShyY1
MTAFVVLTLPVLCGLGVWQLQRAAQKDALYEAYLERSGALPESAAALGLAAGMNALPAAAEFARLRLQGSYRPGEYYLIDNQVRDRAVGYSVLQRFRDADGTIWLVRRGFVASAGPRGHLPEVPAPTGPQVILAVVWPDTGLVPLLQSEPEDDGWPRLRQRVDLAVMAGRDPRTVPAELRLESGQPGVLEPPVLNFPSGADRHRGYAVQWFALAAVLIAGFVVFGSRSGRAQRSESRTS